MKKQWYVKFNENGGEYAGYLTITAQELRQVDEWTVVADGVEIRIDETIIEIGIDE